MKPLETPTVRVVIYEGHGTQPLAEGDRFALTRTLLDRGFTVTCTGAGTHGTVTPGAVASVPEARLVILGRFENGRAPELRDADGRRELVAIDITQLDAEKTSAQLDEALAEREVEVNRPGAWKPWFPVIDYDRCTNCMQCLSFCLFDVYGVDEKNQIQVQNNDNCKTDCPACSRVCPEVAILFPKHKGGPINGDEIREQDLKRDAMKVDISDLLGGDIYGQLRDRSDRARERFAKERDDKTALSERMRCLHKMADGMDIPMSALKNLPSQDEIKKKAEAAKAKAQAALEQQQAPAPQT